MSDHIITLTANEETIYASYLTKTSQTDAAVMAKLKTSLTSQVVQAINEAGTAKFNSLTVVEKIAFLG